MKVEILGRPIAWKRPRACGKRFFDSQKDLKEKIQWIVKTQIASDETFKKPLTLKIDYVYSIPKSWTKVKKTQLIGKPKDTVPDLSNLIKFTEDALNSIVWNDDRLIWRIIATKTYGNEDKTIFSIEEYE